ncbi:MAG: hypothetical protein OXI83_10730, partial [Gemmatimonadota bacterium]|nr:hypothetical protein [Gemmatimonadota bacterium]
SVGLLRQGRNLGPEASVEPPRAARHPLRRGTHSYAVPNTPARLYVNPSVHPANLPPALLHLPHTLGPNGSEYHEGESIASILGLE